jgi:hypothetical protein
MALSMLLGPAKAAPPFIPQAVAVVDGTTDIAGGHVVLRVNLTNADSTVESNIAVGRTAVCSDTACFQSNSPPQFTSAFDTRDGQSQLIVQIAVPAMTVRSLRFGDIGLANRVAGDIVLASPLELTPAFQAGEIMVVVKRGRGAGRSMLTATHAVGTLYSPERQKIFYNPDIATRAKLRLGVELDIPAGAAVTPQLFSVAVHDTGDEHPVVDIFPELKLKKTMVLSSAGLRGVDGPSRPKTKHIDSTGFVRISALATTSGGDDGDVSILADATSCVNAITGRLSGIATA